MDIVPTTNAFVAAAQNLQGDMKPILAFKKGDYFLGQEQQEIPVGTQVALNIMASEWGWIRWHKKEIAERRLTTVLSGSPIPPRDTLGHDDEDLWETDDAGKPQDPWTKVIEIPGKELDGEMREFVLAGSSAGHEGACKALFAAFGKDGMPAKTPIVELDASSYKSKKWGKVAVPVYTLVDYMDVEEIVEQIEEDKPKPKRGRPAKTNF